MPFLVARDISPPPAHEFSGDFVAIFHPGYTPPRLLLRLPCLDNNGTGNGVLFSVVLDAAYVLANNTHGTFKTILSDHSTGSGSELTLNLDELLPAGSYAYYASGQHDYRVCLDFKAWSPPESLPSTWGAVQFRAADVVEPPVRVRAGRNWSEVSLDVCKTDLVCLATKHRDGLRTSHLCPRAEGAWFAYHTLSNQRFRIFTGDVNDPTNLVTMRADIGSTVFDQLHFVIVPINGRTCHYFVREECPEHVYSFHTRHAEVPSRINRALLFYRFAWAMINLAHLLASPATWHGEFIVPIPAALLESEQNLESNKKRKVSHPWSFATETGNNSLEHPPADAVQFADSSGIGPVLDEGNTDREQLVYVNALAGTKFAGLCDLDDELGPEGGIKN
ncbi:hypothetical protein B0H14DRAFT_2916146 [Mycena olivaceomarginata]|nr:hypothetical protein B0H14DRAFT_2916146 [Mycena olivaceomarginata]